jgi:hypothetical protein
MDMDVRRARGLAILLAAAALLTGALAGQAGAVTAKPPKPLKMHPAAVKEATATVPFSEQLSASGGTAPYKYSLASGQLPEGLSISPEGLISGTPTKAQSANYTIEVADAEAHTGSATYLQKVQLGVLPTKPAKTAAFGNAFTPLSAAGGSGPFAFSLAAGTMPEGVLLVSFKAGETALDGTPLVAGTYTFRLEAKDESTGETGERLYRWKIPLAMSPSSGEHLPEATVGHSYHATFNAEGGSHYSYEIIEGELPEGLSLEQEENVEAINGTPGKAETQKITVLAKDNATGLTAKARYTITVAPFAFPKGADVLEEENLGGDELLGRDDVFLTLKHEKNGVATGTMEDRDGSTGVWKLTVATGNLVFNWPEVNHSGGFTYEGQCNLQPEEGEPRCSGVTGTGVWSLHPFRPAT